MAVQRFQNYSHRNDLKLAPKYYQLSQFTTKYQLSTYFIKYQTRELGNIAGIEFLSVMISRQTKTVELVFVEDKDVHYNGHLKRTDPSSETNGKFSTRTRANISIESADNTPRRRGRPKLDLKSSKKDTCDEDSTASSPERSSPDSYDYTRLKRSDRLSKKLGSETKTRRRTPEKRDVGEGRVSRSNSLRKTHESVSESQNNTPTRACRKDYSESDATPKRGRDGLKHVETHSSQRRSGRVRTRERSPNSQSTPTTKERIDSSRKRKSFAATPTKTPKIETNEGRTPRSVARKLANDYPKNTINDLETEEDSFDEPPERESSDEYSPIDRDSDSSSSGSFEESDVAVTPKHRRLSPIAEGTSKTFHTFSARRKLLDTDYDDYRVNADQYFLKKKEPTSTTTIGQFKFTFDEEELAEILDADYVRHEKEIKTLNQDNASKFTLWVAYLRQGFSLLVYGLGSKVKLMEEFRSQMLSDYAVLSVKGFLPKIALRQVLSHLVKDILGGASCSANTEEALVTIANLMKRRKSPVFLIVLNIDGPGLRLMKYQSVLSKLSALPNLHLIATVDHINAPLLCGNKTLSQFNFVWIAAHTFQPYTYETRGVDAFQMQSRVSDDLSSLTKILAPCPDKIKKIFRMIIEDHVKNKGNGKYQGIPFEELSKRAKQKMLATGTSELNDRLYEFYEHNILRRTNNRLFIPIRVDTLTQFYEEYFGSSDC